MLFENEIRVMECLRRDLAGSHIVYLLDWYVDKEHLFLVMNKMQVARCSSALPLCLAALPRCPALPRCSAPLCSPAPGALPLSLSLSATLSG